LERSEKMREFSAEAGLRAEAHASGAGKSDAVENL
jgi:hypothetical protein